MRFIETAVALSRVPLTGWLRDCPPELSAGASRPAVIVCPGGAYAYRSVREADPVALQFAAAGYHAFLLHYTTAGRDGAGAPLGLTPLLEAACAVAAVREHAAEWGVDPHRIALCGFSAGGHLAASLGVHWNSRRLTRELAASGLPSGEAVRPDALILAYPVITAGEHAHAGSIQNLTGGIPEDRAWFSLERQVTKDVPVTFIWHTGADDAVPVENTLDFVRALRAGGVPFECHVFQDGGHGMSLCTPEVGEQSHSTHNAAWMSLCLEWLGERFHFNQLKSPY